MVATVALLHYIIIVQYYHLYSLPCALNLSGLFTTYYKFVPLNTIHVIPAPSFPGNHHFTE